MPAPAATMPAPLNCHPLPWTLVTVVVLAGFLVTTAASSSLTLPGQHGGEFCLMETMQAKCEDNSVILLRYARYGRMRLGRCVKTDFGFVGCSEDVLPVADGRCSGRRSCVIRVPDPIFENTRPCNEEFKSYLEAHYDCMPVATADTSTCQGQDDVKLTSPTGYLANIVTEETRCGGDSAPWRIEGQPGQRINLTLYDFSHYEASAHHHTSSCLIYAFVKEAGSSEKISICGGGQRTKNVYISVSHSLLVFIIRSYNAETERHFLLQYDVFGCPDPSAPDDGWLQREDELAVLGCNDSDDIWRLACIGREWIGKLGNCSKTTKPALDEPYTSPVMSVLSLPIGLAITLIIAIAIGVSAFILLLGLIMLRSRKRLAKRRQRDAILMSTAPSRTYSDKYGASALDCDVKHERGPLGPPTRRALGATLGDNDYAFVWDTSPCPHHGGINIHDEGHVITSCPCSEAMASATYDKATLSRIAAEHCCADLPAPQYFELDPEMLKAKQEAAAQIDLLQNDYQATAARKRGLAPKVAAKPDIEKVKRTLRYNMSDGQLDLVTPVSSEEEEANKLNTLLQNVS